MISKMDYVVTTQRSAPVLKETIASIRKQSNVNQILIVFGWGCDISTIQQVADVVKDGSTRLLFSLGGALQARVEAIKFGVQTDYFVFVDDDVILKDNWIEDVWKYNDGNSALGGVVPFNERHAKVFKKIKKPILRIKGAARTSNTLMRKVWFEDLKIGLNNNQLWGVDENIWFMDYLRERAINFYTVPVLSRHSRKLPVTPIKTGMRMGARWHRMGRYPSWKGMLKHIIGNLVGAFKASFRTRDCYYITKMSKNIIGYFIGYGWWHKYYKKYDYSCKF
jgi:glycosyltransferase involved in cell wall biosynthesis